MLLLVVAFLQVFPALSQVSYSKDIDKCAEFYRQTYGCYPYRYFSIELANDMEALQDSSLPGFILFLALLNLVLYLSIIMTSQITYMLKR